jgi:hypothetical protein
MVLGPHTGCMTPIPGFFIRNLMQSKLLGADAQDPVVADGRSIPDRPLRIGRFQQRLATVVDARARRRGAAFEDCTDERHAA